MTLALLALAIAVLLVFRVPVAFAFLGPSLAYMALDGQSAGQSLRIVTNATASFPLLAVPMFVLLGTLTNRAGMADKLFRFANAALAKLRGNLVYVAIGVSVGFSWMSGSAVADAAALGKVQVPAMIRAGYGRRLSTGVSASAALIAPVMPPSIPAVIFSGLAAISTGALFAASVIPAILMATGLCIVGWLLIRRNPRLTPGTFDRREVIEAGRDVILPMGAPVVILGGILGGIFTPTEAAAVGVVYIIIVALIQRTLTWRIFVDSLKEAFLTTGGILIIVASASLLGYILAIERLPQTLTSVMFSISSSPTAFLLMCVVMCLILGTVIDATAILVLVVPILMPIAAEYGVDPILLGVVLIIALMIGLLTPPVGTVLFVTASVAKVPIGEVFRGTLPFIVPLLLVILSAIFFPGFILWLPSMLGL